MNLVSHWIINQRNEDKNEGMSDKRYVFGLTENILIHLIQYGEVTRLPKGTVCLMLDFRELWVY